MNCRACGAEVSGKTLLPDVCAACAEAATSLQTHRIGDRVERVAKAFGFRQTPGCNCGKRQAALNNVDLSGPKAEVAKALLAAIINPPKE